MESNENETGLIYEALSPLPRREKTRSPTVSLPLPLIDLRVIIINSYLQYYVINNISISVSYTMSQLLKGW